MHANNGGEKNVRLIQLERLWGQEKDDVDNSLFKNNTLLHIKYVGTGCDS